MKITRAPEEEQAWKDREDPWILYKGSFLEFTQYLTLCNIPWWSRNSLLYPTSEWNGEVVIWDKGGDLLWIQIDSEYLAEEFNSLGEGNETSDEKKRVEG